MVAFSASRLVCPAMSLIRRTTSPMRAVELARPRMLLWPASARCTACRDTSAAAAIWREISSTLAVSCSTAAATETRSCDDFAALPAVPLASACTPLAASAITAAALRIASAEVASPDMTPEIEAPKSCVCCSMAACRRSLAARAAACSAATRSASMAFCLNTSTARAMSPISSVLSRAGTSTALFPAASFFMTWVMPASGHGDAAADQNGQSRAQHQRDAGKKLLQSARPG